MNNGERPTEFESKEGSQAIFDLVEKVERNYWLHDTGHFENTKGNQWVQKTLKDTFHLVETDRNDDYVELYDKSRDLTLRLYSDRCLAKGPKTDDKFQKVWDGHWGGN